MTRLLIQWVLSAVLLLVVAHLVPGFQVTGFGAALIAALVIGLVNGTLGFLLKILTFPLTLLTFGLFLLVVNALMLMLASNLVRGFDVAGFLPALLGAVLLALLNMVVRRLTPEND